MKNWTTYQKTYRSEPDIYDFARAGDFRGLANIITDTPDFDFNAVNNRGYCALMLAAYNGQHDFCEALLKCGADVNSCDYAGNTVLMAVAYKGDVNTLAMLLSYGADVTLVNKTNMDVRAWAIMFKRTEILAYLDTILPVSTAQSRSRCVMRFIKLWGVMLLNRKRFKTAKS
ncbi:ankyrin repeat domain-containing protein [Shewanella youngdeokensis]|uniref:Protein fem-1 homolog B n=1 Tax=Shewanella youngdeokensis TaxID=2999068 RepID=A0ABZ0K4F9_9GAMM|nr:ankyrin repeat domain-containing protein [Shewanella sp. DAU334]